MRGKAWSVLAAVVGLILVGTGTVAVATAHRAQAVQVRGAVDLYQRQTCPGNKRSGYTIVLAQDSHSYSTCLARFPALLLPSRSSEGPPSFYGLTRARPTSWGCGWGPRRAAPPGMPASIWPIPISWGTTSGCSGALSSVFGVLALAMGVGLVRRSRGSGASP